MNAALHCLSHTKGLCEYFFQKRYEGEINEKNPLGFGGKLVRSYAKLLENLWIKKKDCYVPISILRLI